MRKLRIFIISLIVFVIATFAGVYIIYNGDDILVNFEITNVKNDFTNYEIEFSEVKAANHYTIQLHDSNNRKVYETDTKNTKEKLSLTNLISGEEYTFKVFAYDKVGDFRPCVNEYKFVWNEATFDKDATILLNNSEYSIPIVGISKNKKYKVRVLENDKVLETTDVTEDIFNLNPEYYLDQEKSLKLELLNGESVVDSIDLFNNMNPLGDVVITTPNNNSIIPYNDFTLSYTGGENAKEFKIKMYKDGKRFQTNTTSKKNVILSKNIFSVGSSYTLEVSAVYDDYVKSSSINITMSDQVQLKPVYISNNWKYVKKGTKLTLATKDAGAKIYYTTNGENPESLGTLYTEPIVVNENMTLKTVSVLEGKMNSVVSTYEINVAEKEKLIVYLSPSNQHGNPGVHEVGYTNEMDEMNDLSNYIQERLKQYGVKVYRNNPAGNINLWNRDSNYLGADLHIAIHSNASDYHNKYGIETWIHAETSQTYSLANIIQNNLMEIYPYNDLEGADRGVKYANGALGEANDNYIPFGMLVEIGHHDYRDDAEWIMNNKKLIGYNVADSILKYYQIID